MDEPRAYRATLNLIDEYCASYRNLFLDVRSLVLAVPLERLIQPVNEIVGVDTLLSKILTFILWYIGFEVTRQGETII